MAWGVIRPRVVLPGLVLDCKRDDRRAILLHELGHVSRRDPLWHLLGELAGVIFWYHPLLWYARHQCAQLRENACDDLVLNAGVEPETYARCLLEFVSRRLPGKETVSRRLQDSAGQPIDRGIVILQSISITKVMSRAVTDSNGRFTMGVNNWAVINGDANIA